MSSERKTAFQLAYEKAEAEKQRSGKYSFAPEQSTETGKITDEPENDDVVTNDYTEVKEKYEQLKEGYGTIKPGEIPQVEDVKVPKKTSKRQYVSKFARTMAETEVFAESKE